MGLLIVIVILVFAIPNIIDFISKQNEEEKEREKRRLEQEKIKNDYDALVQKYVESDLTRKILAYICDGDYEKNIPEIITVDFRFIRSNLKGCPRSFCLTENRINALYRGRDCHWDVSPVEAMAEAINRIMDGQYSVYVKDEVAHMELKPQYDF